MEGLSGTEESQCADRDQLDWRSETRVMPFDKRRCLVWLGLLLLIPTGCRQTDSSKTENFSRLALKGKDVFERHHCRRCHYLGDEEVAAEGSDLLNPFLAHDTLFVQTHLRTVEMSGMPAIKLSALEIRWLSFYVAELYNSRLPQLAPDEIDTYDPVCYAPVSIAKATKQKLYLSFRGEHYYFATGATLEAFRKAPEACAVLFEQFLREKEKLPMANK